MLREGGNSVASQGSLRGLIGFSSGPYQSGGRPCLSFHLRCVRFPLARTRARWPRRKPTVKWGYDINYICKGETSLPLSVSHFRSTLTLFDGIPPSLPPHLLPPSSITQDSSLHRHLTTTVLKEPETLRPDHRSSIRLTLYCANRLSFAPVLSLCQISVRATSPIPIHITSLYRL